MDDDGRNLVSNEQSEENNLNTENNFNTEIDDWKTHPIAIYEKKILPKESLSKLKKPIKLFYKNQNNLIGELIEVNKYDEKPMESEIDVEYGPFLPTDHCHLRKGKANVTPPNKDEILAKVVFGINFLLLVGKAVAAGMTGSLSIISSLMDSSIDLASGLLMWWTSSRMKRFNPYLYPQGRQRLEPISIIVLSVVMTVTSIQLVRESVTTIVNMATAGQKAPNINNLSIGIICATIVSKITLWIVCKRYGSSESSAALAQDSRNDVFSNAVAVLCSSLSSRLYIENLKFLDPCGAIAIAFYILVGWIRTGYENVKNLTGHTASTSFLQKLTFISVNHHPHIKYIDTVRAFHFGINFLVEVDIILDENMPLKDAHDIGESLQKRIECLSEVERCFVHLDYEYIHDPTNEHKRV